MIERYLLVLLITAVSSCPLLSQIRAGGNYPSVSADMILRLRLDHYETADGKLHGADFEWRFFHDEFVVKKGKTAIPPDLLSKLLPKNSAADEIRGHWKLGNGGRDLILTEIKVGEREGQKKVILSIERTGTGVVRVGDPEYVFGVLDK